MNTESKILGDALRRVLGAQGALDLALALVRLAAAEVRALHPQHTDIPERAEADARNTVCALQILLPKGTA